jgi:hypothetical protein
MIEKLKDEGWSRLRIMQLEHKLNEVIDYLNTDFILMYGNKPIPGDLGSGYDAVLRSKEWNKPLEPKWKVGDNYYFIDFSSNESCLFEVEDSCIPLREIDVGNTRDGDLNYFKTKELAEQALREIKQVLGKYQ